MLGNRRRRGPGGRWWPLPSLLPRRRPINHPLVLPSTDSISSQNEPFLSNQIKSIQRYYNYNISNYIKLKARKIEVGWIRTVEFKRAQHLNGSPVGRQRGIRVQRQVDLHRQLPNSIYSQRPKLNSLFFSSKSKSKWNYVRYLSSIADSRICGSLIIVSTLNYRKILLWLNDGHSLLITSSILLLPRPTWGNRLHRRHCHRHPVDRRFVSTSAIGSPDHHRRPCPLGNRCFQFPD